VRDGMVKDQSSCWGHSSSLCDGTILSFCGKGKNKLRAVTYIKLR